MDIVSCKSYTGFDMAAGRRGGSSSALHSMNPVKVSQLRCQARPEIELAASATVPYA